MSESARVPATRVNLLRSRRQLARVEKGAELVRRKREALVGELFRLARPAVGARAAIQAQASHAYPPLAHALAVHGLTGLRVLAWPARDVRVRIHSGQVWGIPVSDIEEKPPMHRTLEARGITPAGAGPSALDAAAQFEQLAELLLDAAPREQRILRLGDAVAHTTRQLRTLEQRMTPMLQSRIAQVRRTLEEREREEHTQLKHVRGRVGRRA